jgi:AraC-like DNA-binding protein
VQLNSLIALTLAESAERRDGGESMLARLSELMFIEVVRLHLRTLPPGHDGWLAGLRDPVVGRALSFLHGDPARGWSLEGLARAVSTSRSALAERFKQLTGLPPMQYLAQWRMQVAASKLAEGNAAVAAVAFDVGYGSEAAFSRAFKKLVGMSPSVWRERGAAAR